MQTSAPLAVTGFDCELCSLSLGAVGASDPGARKDDKPAVSVSVIVVEANITSNATDFLSSEVEDEIDTMGLAAAVVGGILAAGFCAFLAGLCFAYRVVGYWEKKKQKELLQDESESNHVANMPGGFDYEARPCVFLKFSPALQLSDSECGNPDSAFACHHGCDDNGDGDHDDDEDDIVDSHEPPEVQVEQSPPTPNGRAPEMTTDSDTWNPDAMMVEDKISNEDSQEPATLHRGLVMHSWATHQPEELRLQRRRVPTQMDRRHRPHPRSPANLSPRHPFSRTTKMKRRSSWRLQPSEKRATACCQAHGK
eukprot:s480_g11.t1